jgi:anthranilate phosphoribosyltransferase
MSEASPKKLAGFPERSSPEEVSFFANCAERVRQNVSLPENDAQQMMELIVRGVVPSECIEDYLVALAEKSENADEIVGSARALRDHAVPFHASGNCIDNCGTGGDGAGTFNISTVSALVIAAAGQPVVKHGNRSASGRVGSADLMEALGVKVDLNVEVAQISLQRFNFAFLYAPYYHPAAKRVAPLRKRLGRPTIFNLLGPLCNPAQPPYQLIGVPSRTIAEKISQAVLRLGIKRAFIVTGNAGVDELIPEGCNDVFVVEGGRGIHTTFSGHDAGLDECSLNDIQGGDVERNATIAMNILDGDSGPPRDAVLFNASAALLCTGAVRSLKEGCARCRAAIDNGDARKLLHNLRSFSRERRSA